MKTKRTSFTVAGMAVLSFLAAASTVQAGGAANTIEIGMERIDDHLFPGNDFTAFVDITLEDESVTGVNVVTAGGLDLDLEYYDHTWDVEIGFGDLASMRTAMNGAWTITIDGPTPSVSTFTMNLGGLADGDFFDVPTNLFPAHGDAGVPADVEVSWDDPTPPGAADVVFLHINDTGASTIEGNLAIDATSWAPPSPLGPGSQEFAVGYVVFADAGTAGPIAVDPPGAVEWGLLSYAPPGYPANQPLVYRASETIVAFIVGEPARLVVAMERIDAEGAGPFAAFVSAELPGLDAASVDVYAPGLVVPLEMQGTDVWEANVSFADLAALRDALHGTWSIEVFGDNHSLSQFDLNLAALVDDDFFATPTDVFPGQGATGIPADVTVSWSDPTGGDADLLFVHAGGQEVSSIEGTLDISDESWTPDLPLDPGFNELSIGYYRIDDAAIASPIFAQGAIGWGTHELAPPGYPQSTPLVGLGSETISTFEVGVVCPADVSGDGVVSFADVLAILGAWGPCGECPQDANRDGSVGFADILLVLGQWGPCGK